jgi:hypothetical protein
MINDQDGHIPSPLIMFTCTVLRHALLEWQKNNGVHPKASRSKLKSDRPDRSNFFNHKNDGRKIASCRAEPSRKLLNSPGVAVTYIFLMNTWNTPPESYQQKVYYNTLATVKGQMQQGENPTPAVVISGKAVHVDNAILLDCLASEVALEHPEIGSTDPNIPIDNNCMDDKRHFRMLGGSRAYDDEGDERDDRDAILTTSRQRQPTTELQKFDLGTRDVDRYEGENGDDADADADEEQEVRQVDDGSMQNVED